MARRHREGGAAQTASGRLYRLGDLTPEYLLAFRRAFPSAGELTRYLSSSLRWRNVPAIVARVMAAYLGRHNQRARGEIFCECDVWRLQILHDGPRLQHLYVCVRATPFGEAGMKERRDRFRQRLGHYVQIMSDDWKRPALDPKHGFIVNVRSRAASMLTLPPSPPRMHESDLGIIDHLLFIADAVLSRSFKTEFPPDTSTCPTCRSKARTSHRRSF